MASPVTLCERSYHGLPSLFAGRVKRELPPETCDNPVAPCPVLYVEHQGHNWLPPSLLYVKPQWWHCKGVSLPGERRVGA